MHCLAACEEAERIIKKAKYFPSSVPPPSYHHQTRIGRETNIRELYEAECARDLETGQPELRSGSMLLEKLAARESLHTLIINLYAGNKGFSVAVRKFVTADDTICLDSNPSTSNMRGKMYKEIELSWEFNYKTDRLLRYIDNEELPFFLISALESEYSYMFYSGCIIAEIRDYRQAYPRIMYDTHYVLLKPSTQTFHCETSDLANKYDLNENDRRQLESKILAKTIPLCLDPSPANVIVANRIQHERQIFNTLDIRKAAHSYSQVATNRKRKLTNTPRRGFELLEASKRHRTRTRNNMNSMVADYYHLRQPFELSVEDSIYPAPIAAPSFELPPLKHPPQSEIPVAAFARHIDPLPLSADGAPRPVETFEKTINDRDPEQNRVNHIKLTIFQRLSNLEYVGELYLDSDYQQGQSKGSACQFSLGHSRRHAYGYLSQFLEIFNETAPSTQHHSTIHHTHHHHISTNTSNISSSASSSSSNNNINATPENTVPANQIQNNARSVITHLANGNVTAASAGSVVLLQGSQGVISASTSQINSNLPILQSQLQANNQNRSHLRQAPFTIARSVDPQQYQVTVSQPSTVRATSSPGNNATILSRLNSTPVNHQNSAESAAVANAIINNSNIAIVGLTPHRTIAINQKTASRNMLANNTTRLTTNRAGQLVTTNNSGSVNSLQQPVQINLSSLTSQLANAASVNQGQPQTFNITSLNAGNIGFTAVPLNNVNTQGQKLLNNHNATTRLIAPNSATSPSPKRTLSSSPSNNDSRLHALLKGTAAADHHVEGANSDSGLLERIRASSGTSPVPSASPTNPSPKNLMHLVSQSPKINNNNPSPLSSPPLSTTQHVIGQSSQQNTANTLQSLNLAQLTNFSTNQQSELIQLQIPIQLPISMSSAVSHTGVLLPITTGATSNSHIMSNASAASVASNATVVPFILAQSVNKSNVRGATSQQLQVVSALQRPRSTGSTHSATRALLTAQRTTNTPIRIAAPNSNVPNLQTMNTSNVAANSIVTLSGQPQHLQLALQKQAQLQQFQQIQLQQRINQQQKVGMTPASVATKYRRRSNAADPNK